MGRISERAARLIRIGIMSKCMPYKTGGNPVDGYWTTLDMYRLWKYGQDYRDHVDSRLVERARYRTEQWVSVRDVD